MLRDIREYDRCRRCGGPYPFGVSKLCRGCENELWREERKGQMGW